MVLGFNLQANLWIVKAKSASELEGFVHPLAHTAGAQAHREKTRFLLNTLIEIYI